jgi:hypothetical protein
MILDRVLKSFRSLFMKLSRLCLAALVTTISCCGLFAGTEKPHQGKKLYVDSQAVAVRKNGILVKTQAGNLLVRILRSDEKGIYILEKDVSSAEKGWAPDVLRRKCPYCGHWSKNPSAHRKHVYACPYNPKNKR